MIWYWVIVSAVVVSSVLLPIIVTVLLWQTSWPRYVRSVVVLVVSVVGFLIDIFAVILALWKMAGTYA